MQSTDHHIQSLLTNALDFLRESLNDFEKRPKYSVIHFYTAMELFLKARLMNEHWTLIVTGKGPADRSAFDEGNFRSIGLEDSFESFKRSLREPLDPALTASLKELRSHRNRCVHFYHQAHSERAKADEKAAIAKEQLRVWFHLRKWIKEERSGFFAPWELEFASLNSSFQVQKDFLQVAFDETDPQRKELSEAGWNLIRCPSCGFSSLPVLNDNDAPTDTQCIVCENTVFYFGTRCSKCSEPLHFIGEGFGVCTQCEASYEPEDLCNMIEPFLEDEYSLSGETRGNCAECDGSNTVIEHPGWHYFCTSCFQPFHEMYMCEWCNELNTRENVASSILGCSHCSGSPNYD